MLIVLFDQLLSVVKEELDYIKNENHPENHMIKKFISDKLKIKDLIENSDKKISLKDKEKVNELIKNILNMEKEIEEITENRLDKIKLDIFSVNNERLLKNSYNLSDFTISNLDINE